MGLFDMFIYRKPTTAEKREIEALVSRTKTCVRKLNETDIIETYFIEWDKLDKDMEELLKYENEKHIRFTPSIASNNQGIQEKRAQSEKEFIDRAYYRLQRSLLKVKTENGKNKKIEEFFEELKFYYPKLRDESIAYVEELQRKVNGSEAE